MKLPRGEPARPYFLGRIFRTRFVLTAVSYSGLSTNGCRQSRPHPDPLPSDGRGRLRHALGKAEWLRPVSRVAHVSSLSQWRASLAAGLRVREFLQQLIE